MQYPVFIQKEADSGCGVVVPDLLGCYSAGDTIEYAIKNVHETIECHLDEYTKNHGGNRLAFLADAAMSFMAEHA